MIDTPRYWWFRVKIPGQRAFLTAVYDAQLPNAYARAKGFYPNADVYATAPATDSETKEKATALENYLQR
jgi:hypothetical protein